MPGRDDISKLPMPASGKKYARRSGKDIKHNFSQYAKMVSDVTASPESGQKIKDVGVVQGMKEGYRSMEEFLKQYPNLYKAIYLAIAANVKGDPYKILQQTSSGELPVSGFKEAEEFASSLNPAELDSASTDAEAAELLGLDDRPGFIEFENVMNCMYRAVTSYQRN